MSEAIGEVEFYTRLAAQGVSDPDHWAFKCPVCGTVQSIASLMTANLSHEGAYQVVGYACEGRFRNAGPYRKGAPAAVRGCDWTLGGLLQIHELVVTYEGGQSEAWFMPATAQEAQALERAVTAGEIT